MQYWQPNQTIKNGKFTIQKILGGGGYGVTYSAIDNNTGKIIAIKFLFEEPIGKLLLRNRPIPMRIFNRKSCLIELAIAICGWM